MNSCRAARFRVPRTSRFPKTKEKIFDKRQIWWISEQKIFIISWWRDFNRGDKNSYWFESWKVPLSLDSFLFAFQKGKIIENLKYRENSIVWSKSMRKFYNSTIFTKFEYTKDLRIKDTQSIESKLNLQSHYLHYLSIYSKCQKTLFKEAWRDGTLRFWNFLDRTTMNGRFSRVFPPPSSLISF